MKLSSIGTLAISGPYISVTSVLLQSAMITEGVYNVANSFEVLKSQ